MKRIPAFGFGFTTSSPTPEAIGMPGLTTAKRVSTIEHLRTCPIHARIDEVVVVNESLKTVFKSTSTKTAAVEFMAFMVEKFGKSFSADVSEIGPSSAPYLFGFEIRQLLRLAAISALSDPGISGMKIPATLWCAPWRPFKTTIDRTIDPYESAITSSEQDLVPLGKLCQTLDVPYQSAGSAEHQARTALELARKLQLFFED